MPGDGTDFVSLIHVADMAHATMAAVERAPIAEHFSRRRRSSVALGGLS
jgi:hypothetical protein